MMLRFDRLVMPDGRRLGSTLKLSSFTMRLPVKQSTSKARSNPVAEDEKSIEHTVIGAGAAPYWVESSAGARVQDRVDRRRCGRVGHDRLHGHQEDHAQ